MMGNKYRFGRAHRVIPILIIVILLADTVVGGPYTRYNGSITTPTNTTFKLNPGEKIWSLTDNTRLKMNPGGNLVLYDNNQIALWSTHTHNENSYVIINLDGNIQIKNSTDSILWESNTNDNSATSPYSLHVIVNCAYLIDKHNTLLWNVGTGCTPITQTHIFINNQCLPIDDISWVNEYQIAWINVVSCAEDTDTFIYHYDKSNIFEDLATSAISVKMEPSGGISNPDYDNFTVTVIPYSNPVYALRNNIELSYIYDPNTNTISGTTPDTSNWIGSWTAINRLSGTCIEPGAPFPASNRLFHACGNFEGVHLYFDSDCYWELNDIVGHDMEVYFGFELIECPTEHPSISPTKMPTFNPVEHPSISPTKIPTLHPVEYPSLPPIQYSTQELTSTATMTTNDIQSGFNPNSSLHALKTSQSQVHIVSSDAPGITETVLSSVENKDGKMGLIIVLLIIVGVLVIIVGVLLIVVGIKNIIVFIKRKRQELDDGNTQINQKIVSVSVEGNIGENMNIELQLNDERIEGQSSIVNVRTKGNIAEDEFEVIGDDETARE